MSHFVCRGNKRLFKPPTATRPQKRSSLFDSAIHTRGFGTVDTEFTQYSVRVRLGKNQDPKNHYYMYYKVGPPHETTVTETNAEATLSCDTVQDTFRAVVIAEESEVVSMMLQD